MKKKTRQRILWAVIGGIVIFSMVAWTAGMAFMM
jgi:hypothetical protein